MIYLLIAAYIGLFMTIALQPRWWRELWHPDLKCERCGHDMHADECGRCGHVALMLDRVDADSTLFP